jgi:beta-galactosidase
VCAYTDVYSRMRPSVPGNRVHGYATTPHCFSVLRRGVRPTAFEALPAPRIRMQWAMDREPSTSTYTCRTGNPRLHGWDSSGGVIKFRHPHPITPEGAEYFGYGGTSAEVHDGNFVMDGMILSDDTLMPSLGAEYARGGAIPAPQRFPRISAAVGRKRRGPQRWHRSVPMTNSSGGWSAIGSPAESGTPEVPARGVRLSRYERQASCSSIGRVKAG